MITKEQAFGMYKHIAKIYYINDGHPEIKYDWDWGDISSTLNLSGGDSFCCEIPFGMIDDCKLILRPFRDITEQEWKPIIKIEKILYDSCVIEFYSNCAKTLRYNYLYFDHEFNREIRNYEYLPINKLGRKSLEYLISIGIDVFNLKERGWAVYESDLKGENNETN